jgi:hypothetical protein
MVTCLPLDARFAGLNQTENDGFLRAIAIRITTSFKGEVKPSVSCLRFYGMLNNPTNMKEMRLRQNSAAFSR